MRARIVGLILTTLVIIGLGGSLAFLLQSRSMISSPAALPATVSSGADDRLSASAASSSPGLTCDPNQSALDLVPPPRDLAELAGQSNLIVIGRIVEIVRQGTFEGYNSKGEMIIAEWGGSPGADVPFTDYRIEVEQTVMNDRPELDEPLIFRLTGHPSPEAERDRDRCSPFPMSRVGDRHLFFLGRNPDNTSYGTHFGPWSRLNIDGPTVTISDGPRTLVLIGGVPVATAAFLDRLISVVREQQAGAAASVEPFWSPTPAPAPTEPPLTTIELAIASLARSSGLNGITTPTIRSQVELASGVAVLYTYEGKFVGGEPVTAIHLSYLDRRGDVWYPDGSTYEYRDADDPQPKVQIIKGSFVVNGGPDTPQKPDEVSLVGGLVADPLIGQLAITYADGSTEVVAVIDGVYLGAKLDAGGVLRVEPVTSSQPPA